MKQKFMVLFVIILLLFSNVTLLSGKSTNKTGISTFLDFKDNPTLLSSNGESLYTPGELIIKFKESIQPDFIRSDYKISSVKKLIKDSSCTIFSDIYVLYFEDKELDMYHVAEQIMDYSIVEYAEPNYIFKFCNEPDDPYYEQNYQWALNQNNDCDIDAPQAWDITTGRSDLTIAVLDTGVDYNHPDLIDNIWHNNGEIQGNGIDDDNNGYIDDYNGFDFYESVDENGDGDYDDEEDILDYDPMDNYGHGTHCAGIIAAVGNNQIGISGVCWNSKIMPVRVGSPEGINLSSVAEGIYYAKDNGAKIISMSFSGAHSELIEDVISSYSNEILFVAAAGNYNSDIKSYPAALEDVIAVASTDSNDNKMHMSNFGDWVDLAAPGVNILSLRANGTDMYEDGSHIFDKNDKYYYASGTSMACPYVAGVAGLLYSKNENINPDKAMDILCHSVDRINPDLNIGRGRVNAFKALKRGTNDISALIKNPSHGEQLSGSVNIIGDAFGSGFEKYYLEFASGTRYESASWIEIVESTEPVNNDLLGSLDVTGLSDGFYSVRLIVESNDGIYEDLIWILINSGQNTVFVDILNTNGPWDGTEQHPFKSIQEGIDFAGEADTVFVKSGTYQETVTIDKKINLIGEDKNKTIIDGIGETYCIQLDQINGVEIIQFTIKNASWGISLRYSSENTIKENLITENVLGVIHSRDNSINNLFYHNNFFNNDDNAYSPGDNFWYNSEINEGNYWDDYIGWYKNRYDEDPVDENKDGIWDVPYDIPGGDCQDRYPWVNQNGEIKSKHVSKTPFTNLYDFSKILQFFYKLIESLL